MKNRYISFVLLLFFFIGCSSVEIIKEDYLYTDDPTKPAIEEAFQTLKTDYLGASNSVLASIKRRAELIAYDHIMLTKYKYIYEVRSPKLDEEWGMPEMQQYLFVHFKPNEQNQKLDKIYLVVIKRLNDKIVYAGEYKFPQGDPFYRYNDILKEIGY